MKIVQSRPPNWDQIADKFGPWSITNAVFTYGDTVYAPMGINLPEDLKAHEQVHIDRQTTADPKLWWTMYLNDPVFRLREELEAYKAQYQYAVTHYGRPHRRRLLAGISHDLAGAMYGQLVNKSMARALITGADAVQ